MKQSLKKLVLVAALSAATLTASAEQKIATVDLRRLFEGYFKTKQADSGLKEESAEIEKQLKEMSDALKKGDDDYKKLLDKANDQAIAPEERDKGKAQAEKKLLELRETQGSIKQFYDNNRQRLAEKNKRIRDKILGEINDVIAAKAKAGSYTLVLDTAADTKNDTKVLVFTAGESDLTDPVLTQLNSTAPAGWDKEAAKPAPDATPVAPLPSTDKDGKKDSKK
jgi:Skp family chaperone for outer membrane proteins